MSVDKKLTLSAKISALSPRQRRIIKRLVNALSSIPSQNMVPHDNQRKTISAPNLAQSPNPLSDGDFNPAELPPSSTVATRSGDAPPSDMAAVLEALRMQNVWLERIAVMIRAPETIGKSAPCR